MAFETWVCAVQAEAGAEKNGVRHPCALIVDFRHRERCLTPLFLDGPIAFVTSAIVQVFCSSEFTDIAHATLSASADLHVEHFARLRFPALAGSIL